MFSNSNLNRYVISNYDYIKTILQKEWFKMKRKEFNEDVFHDTLLKCMKKFETKKFIEKEFMAYTVRSFQTNVLRYNLYFENSKRDSKEVTSIKKEISDNETIDFGLLYKKITTKYSQEYCNIFIDWIDGNTIKELNKKYNRKNCRYIIDKVKRFIVQNYSRDDFV